MSELNMIITDSREKQGYVSIGSTVFANSIANLRALKVGNGPLVASAAANSFTFVWQNPEANRVIVREVIIYVSTEATGASTMDVDIVATATTVPGATIYDDLNLATVTPPHLYSSHNAAQTGAGGLERARPLTVAGGGADWVVGYATNATTDLVGEYYIIYQEV